MYYFENQDILFVELWLNVIVYKSCSINTILFLII